jgi:hypothetical protein
VIVYTLKVSNPEGYRVETPVFESKKKASDFVGELAHVGFFDDETDSPRVVELGDGFVVAVDDTVDGGVNYVDAQVVGALVQKWEVKQ